MSAHFSEGLNGCCCFFFLSLHSVFCFLFSFSVLVVLQNIFIVIDEVHDFGVSACLVLAQDGLSIRLQVVHVAQCISSTASVCVYIR